MYYIITNEFRDGKKIECHVVAVYTDHDKAWKECIYMRNAPEYKGTQYFIWHSRKAAYKFSGCNKEEIKKACEACKENSK